MSGQHLQVGRRPRVLRPPSLRDPHVAGGPLFDVNDLSQLADAAGLKLSLLGRELAEVTTELRRAFVWFILEQASHTMWKEPTSEIQKWATRAASVMWDCITALGGDPAVDYPLDDGTGPAAATAGLLQQGISVAEGTGDIVRLHRLLQSVAPGLVNRPPNAQALELVITRVVNGLTALALVADRAAEGWGRQQKHFGRRPTAFMEPEGTLPAPRWALFYRLAQIFEQLHSGRKFAVSKYSSGGTRKGSKTAGPAVVWTRALFDLASDPKHQWPGGPLYPELTELAKWSIEKSEGFAEHIDEAGRRYRDAQHRGAGSRRPE